MVVYTEHLEQVLHPCLILCFHCAYFAVSGELRRFSHWLLVGCWLGWCFSGILLHIQNNSNFALCLLWACLRMIVGCLQPLLLPFTNLRPEANWLGQSTYMFLFQDCKHSNLMQHSPNQSRRSTCSHWQAFKLFVRNMIGQYPKLAKYSVSTCSNTSTTVVRFWASYLGRKLCSSRLDKDDTNVTVTSAALQPQTLLRRS